ncbi:C40 family peptidase [Actinophytocola oryzae]|uniref:NlpC/P60 family protein n=1 Tax=Actinophytocola oryzae TaxID=502181 RepID=A0A4R7UR91_9PSEU|nr:C40 family peptidase [Actinophytocola oryzae]TDV37558.1 NlpC/P60 family protein [Actinophytocola oryzae]
MKSALVVGGLVVVATVAVAGVSAVTQVVSQDQAADQARAMSAGLNCNAALGPITAGPAGSGAGDAAKLNEDQRKNVALIISIGKDRQLPPLAWQVAIQAGMTESGLRNLNYGDRDSLGMFQMRPSMGWGTPAQVVDPHYSINKFYDVLGKVPGWEQQRPGESAQDVERSGFPDRYHKWESMAAHLIGNVGLVPDPTGCGQGTGLFVPAPTEQSRNAIQWALGQQGKPYVWGARTDQQGSFDCSSLMLQAYRAAGITLPRVSRQQYRAGAMLPVEQAQPGDLLFWGYDRSDPDTIHHVAMYLGDGKIVEAQQTGVPVHIRSVRWGEAELMGQAVRPGV